MPVLQQLATDQTDPWQVVYRQVFTPHDSLLISAAFVVLCRVGCLWVTSIRWGTLQRTCLFTWLILVVRLIVIVKNLRFKRNMA